MRASERYQELLDDVEFIKNGIDVLILYLAMAINPELSEDLRKDFREMINGYLERRNTTLNEIYEREFQK